jgi:predicted metal-binding membrane protein
VPTTVATASLRRDRAIVVGGLALLGALAWAYLVHLHGPMMGQRIGVASMEGAMAMPGAPAWQGADVLVAFLMWVVMMVAMMTSSATPMLLMVAALSRQRQQHPAPPAVTAAVFAGYLAAWAGFSLGATLVQWGLQSAVGLSPVFISVRPLVEGLLLLLAGAYQFTPLKHACLSRCRTPLGFLLAEWRDGTAGALAMGVRHGGYCVGCCWLLMALLFAVGVMNLLWVALIAVYVLLEKVSPGGAWLSRAMGVLLVGWGIRLLIATM